MEIQAVFELIPAVSYTVSFDTGGAGAITSQTVGEGDKAVKPADPVRDGYEFGGWYSDAAFTTAFDFDSAITGDITIYAKWTSSSAPDGNKPVVVPATGEDASVTIAAGLSLIAAACVFAASATIRSKREGSDI